MFSKTSMFAIGVMACFMAASAAPTKIQTASRQDEFVFAAPPAPPVVAATPEPTPAVEPAVGAPVDAAAPVLTTATTPEPAAPVGADVPVAGVPAPASAMTPEPTAAADEGMVAPAAMPAAVAAPPMATETEPGASAEPVVSIGSVPALKYNVGGAAFLDYEADPEAWVVGDTAAFEIPEAVVAEADPPTSAPLYRSHRYGLLGSTWGYDIPITTPGTYECSLHYCETYSEFFTAEPNRTFKVLIYTDGNIAGGQTAEFDVMVELQGQEFTAYKRTFSNIAATTTISIRETPITSDAFLSGITCEYVSA